MRFDKQTLAWVNQSYIWMRKLMPYNNTVFMVGSTGRGIAEGAMLPDTNRPTFGIYHDYETGKDHHFQSDGWGFNKWHHSMNLVDNECQCDRCMGISDEWDEYDIIKRKIKEIEK